MITREELIKCCEKGFVSQDLWHDRDSASAQMQLGQAYALLKAGCEFEINEESSNGKATHIRVFYKGFGFFENCYEEDENEKDFMQKEHFYIPTKKALREARGQDWY